jgi:hypothetical protein
MRSWRGVNGGVGGRGGGGGGGGRGDDKGDGECVVWISLLRRRGQEGTGRRVERIGIPASLTVSTSDTTRKGGKKTSRAKETGPTTTDFDDAYLASQLRTSYCSLAGPWFLRTISARKLSYIQLGQIDIWSGSSSSPSSSNFTLGENNGKTARARLLSKNTGFDISDEARLFTEHNLMDLYRHPDTGKARYTWVHWARRVAASNSTSPHESVDVDVGKGAKANRRGRSLDVLEAVGVKGELTDVNLPRWKMFNES